jgi:hypothetical protein
MFGNYRTVENRLVCMVRKNADKVFNKNNQNKFRRRKANATNYVFEVPEQDFLFVSTAEQGMVEWFVLAVLNLFKFMTHRLITTVLDLTLSSNSTISHNLKLTR